MPDDMWTPFKQLQRVVDTFLTKRAPDGSLASLELILQKHKPDFINLLKNSVSLINLMRIFFDENIFTMYLSLTNEFSHV